MKIPRKPSISVSRIDEHRPPCPAPLALPITEFATLRLFFLMADLVNRGLDITVRFLGHRGRMLLQCLMQSSLSCCVQRAGRFSNEWRENAHCPLADATVDRGQHCRLREVRNYPKPAVRIGLVMAGLRLNRRNSRSPLTNHSSCQ